MAADINPKTNLSYDANAHQRCVRADALFTVRQHVQKLAQTARRGVVSRSHQSCPDHQRVMHVPQRWPLEANWHYFSGPIHLNALGSALLACTVREAVLRACTRGCCDKAAPTPLLAVLARARARAENATATMQSLADDFCQRRLMELPGPASKLTNAAARTMHGLTKLLAVRTVHHLNVLEARFAAEALAHGGFMYDGSRIGREAWSVGRELRLERGSAHANNSRERRHSHVSGQEASAPQRLSI